MKQQTFSRITILLLALTLLPQIASAQEVFDPENGVFHSQRLANGVPFGGIGTGTFQMLTDGTFAHAAMTNNWQQPTGDLPGCFAALWTRTGGRTQAHVLALTSPYKLPTVAALDYDGQPPQATLTYPDRTLPLSLTLRAFSPLVPFDLKNSSLPAAAFVFQLRNKSTDTIEVSLALSWENLLGMGGTAAKGPFASTNAGAIIPIPSAEGFFGLHFSGPPLTTGNSPEERLRDNATGDMALLSLPERKEIAVTTAVWNVRDTTPTWWNEFAKEGQVSGEAGKGAGDNVQPAGVVAVRLTLKPGDFVEIPFAVAWHTPRYYTLSGVEYRHYDGLLYADALQAGRTLLTERRSLLALTEEWQQALQFSNLPRWIVRRIINSVTPLLTNSIHTDDGKFVLFSGGTSGSRIPRSDESRAANALLYAFFPSLRKEQIQPDNGLKPFDAEYALTVSAETDKKASDAPPKNASTPLMPRVVADAIAQIAAGKPDEGVAALQAFDAANQTAPWVTTGGITPPVPDLAQAEDWLLLDALTGFAYDEKSHQLVITPHLAGTWRSLLAPVFAPGFRGRIEYKPRAHGGIVTFRLDRLVALAENAPIKRPSTNTQLVVASLRVPGPPRGETSPTTVHASLFQTPLGARISVEPITGNLIVTLDTPLVLTAGDRLEIDVH